VGSSCTSLAGLLIEDRNSSLTGVWQVFGHQSNNSSLHSEDDDER